MGRCPGGILVLEQGRKKAAGTSLTFKDIEEEDATKRSSKLVQFELGAYFSDDGTDGRYEPRRWSDGYFQDFVRVFKNAFWICILKETGEAGDMGGSLLVIKSSKEFYHEAPEGSQ